MYNSQYEEIIVDDLTFVCWKWDSSKYPHGRKKRRDFTAQHVNVLYAMLTRHVSIPFRLICVTDDPAGIRPEVEIIPLWEEFRDKGGCFVRLVPFKKDFNLFGPRFISIDLDCVILRDITPLFERKEDFVIWTPQKAVRWLPKGQKGPYYCGSFWMLKAGARSIVYDTFKPDDYHLGFDGRYEGGTDQKHISKILYPREATWTIQDGVYTFVGDMVRTKHPARFTVAPKIVFFNGRFMPDDIECRGIDWIKNNYTELTRNGMVAVGENVENAVTPTMSTGINDKVNIVAFYWGNWPGDKYDGIGIPYIKKLIQGVKQYMPSKQEYQFILFTNDESIKGEELGIVIRRLDVPLDLKWNLKKIYMFSKQSELDGPTICFDLDTLIVDDLSPLIKKVKELDGTGKNKIIVCEDAYVLGKAGGSIVGFIPSPELERILWVPIMVNQARMEKLTRGSERYYYRHKKLNKELLIDFWEKLIPGRVLSYKTGCRNKPDKPANVSVVRFHGLPRPHQAEKGWVKDLWDIRELQ